MSYEMEMEDYHDDMRINNTPKKCLVTGGAGFVGTNLIKKLLKNGHKVTSIDNYSTGFRKNHVSGCNYVDGDVCKSWGTIDEFGDFDIIFHMAALARIQPSIKNPKNTILNNFNSTLNVLEYARKNNVQVIYAGSSSRHHGLYGSPYAWSKYGGEELCKLYGQVYDVSTSICRFYNVYGPHQITDGAYATVIGIFQRQYLNGEPLTITGDGSQRRDFTHVDDIVNGLIKLIGKEYKGETFEFGSGKNYSINELADFFNTKTEYISSRPGEYDVTLCDYSKAEQYVGYKPNGDLQKYIKQWLEVNK